jgi:plasmid maintenance system antidote protein VapI
MRPENRRPTSPAEMPAAEFEIHDVDRVTPENVDALAERTGASREFWLNLQRAHDEWRPATGGKQGP